MSPQPIRLFRSFATVGGWTMGSRVLGSLLIGFTLVAQLAMPWLVLALASGFKGDERFDLAVIFARICFPYIILISLAALVSGVLNSIGRFAVAAAAPMLLNLSLIGALALSETGFLSGIVAGTHLAGPSLSDLHTGTMQTAGVLLAGLLQLGLVWRGAAKAGMGIRLRLPHFGPEMRRLAMIALPAALAGGVMQINIVVGRQVASHFEGAVAWLWYADRLFQLPLGVVGVAVGVVLLPELSRRVRAEDASGSRDAMNRAAEFCLILVLPSAAAFLSVPGLLSNVLFERGAFTAEDTYATAFALSIYALGLPAFVLLKVIQPAFFAREDTRTPLLTALGAMLANAVVAGGGAVLFGWIAAPMGSVAAAWMNLFLLWRFSRRFGEAVAIDARLRHRAPRILAAAVLMGLVAAAATRAAFAQGWGPSFPLLLGVVLLSAVVYFGLATLFGGFRMTDLRASLRRGRAG